MGLIQKIALGFVGIVVVGFLAFKVFAPTIVIPPREEGSQAKVGEKVSFLNVPEGFEATYYAKNVPGARIMEFAPDGRIVVSQTSEGKISLLEDKDTNGSAETVTTLASGLDSPHGLAFDCRANPCKLYVATQSKLLRYSYNTGVLSGKEELLTFPARGTDRHKTRTLLFLGAPYDDTLLISVGSSCDVCREDNDMYAGITAYSVATKKVTHVAKGLRNAVFMTLNPINGIVFATEMGRDGLGDALPPDEVNILEPEKIANVKTPLNFGWPICYGANIHDTAFDKNTYVRNPCMEPLEIPAWGELPAHSAPLGLAFIPEEGWPEDWWFDLVVAYHGSWNRSTPTGYKLVKITLDGKGNAGTPEDFVSGWLTGDGKKLGRPVDVKILSGGTIYISDDETGVIYKIARESV